VQPAQTAANVLIQLSWPYVARFRSTVEISIKSTT
jgi:hypothetical protein